MFQPTTVDPNSQILTQIAELNERVSKLEASFAKVGYVDIDVVAEQLHSAMSKTLVNKE